MGKLDKLSNDYSELKQENRDIEQKIQLMTTKLSKIENDITDEENDDYLSLAQSQYDNWDELEPLTRRFIPLAEFLYSKLQKLDNPDYSPVIIELCRAIENEFLLKIFRKYTLDLIERYPSRDSLNQFLAFDRSNNDLNKKTGLFVVPFPRAVKNCKSFVFRLDFYYPNKKTTCYAGGMYKL